MLDHLTIVTHPLVQHKLTLMREKDTSTASFRKLLREIKGIHKSQPIVAQCLGGGRSAIATSILQRAGFDVTNMQGGYKA